MTTTLPAQRGHAQRVLAMIAAAILALSVSAGTMMNILMRTSESPWKPIGQLTLHDGAAPQLSTLDGQAIYIASLEGQLVAFVTRDPHSSCQIAWAPSEQHYIDPCHGSVYQPDGSYIRGPAPRSMDRLALRVADGTIEIAPALVTPGPAHP